MGPKGKYFDLPFRVETLLLSDPPLRLAHFLSYFGQCLFGGR